MTFSTITDAYNDFVYRHGTETPVRSQADLQSLIHAAELRYEDIDERFWELAWGDASTTNQESWAFGTIDWPTDAQWAEFDLAAVTT